MKALDKFLEFQVDKITTGRPLPIDLNALSVDIGVVVEEREMIPEAAMQAVDGRLHIYIQSNFNDLPGSILRRRFSYAHEIGHTLFYEQRDGELKARKDSPRGDALEAACHKAASMILVPSKILRIELRDRELTNTDDVVMLATHFEVSLEVMVRRLHESGAFDRNWTAVLARRVGGTLAVEYAAYTHWLIPHIVAPVRGMPFSEWFRGVQQPDGKLIKRVNGGSLEATPQEVTKTSVIFGFRLPM